MGPRPYREKEIGRVNIKELFYRAFTTVRQLSFAASKLIHCQTEVGEEGRIRARAQ